jgi:hypothetical protein
MSSDLTETETTKVEIKSLTKILIKPIHEAANKSNDKTLYKERYEHVTTIWNTVVNHMLRDGEFKDYHKWITKYSNPSEPF